MATSTVLDDVWVDNVVAQVREALQGARKAVTSQQEEIVRAQASAEAYRAALKWVLQHQVAFDDQFEQLKTPDGNVRAPDDIALTIESVANEVSLGAEHAG